MSDADDTRILNMRINNKEFLKGTSDSLKAIDTLNKGIDNAGKGKGMQNMSKSVDTVKTRFGAMQIAGVTAIATITNKAVDAGLRLAKSMTIQPILDGFREYQKLLTSTQTIAANTNNNNAKGIKVVGTYLDNLNHYSDQTIYNFGQMADNLGRFTAAGVSLKNATSSIKGLANAAALSGSNTEQLNTAMYQMSQALSTGTIKLMDWNSLANAGMGGSNIRKALMATTDTFKGQGKVMDNSIKKYGSFRESLRSGWLTADTFNKTMKVMAGTTDEATKKTVAFSVKQLEAMGYTHKSAIELHNLSQAAIDSATKIKTFSQLIDVVKEALGSGWAGIFRALFGDLSQATEMWTKVGGVITGATDRIFGSITRMLDVWRTLKDTQTGMTGFQMFWAAIGNIFKSIGNLLHPFVVLIQALLPASDSAGTGLTSLSKGFYQFSVILERVTSGLNYLTPVFKFLGTAIRFVVTAIKAAVSALAGPAAELLAKGREMGANLIDGLVQGLNGSSIVQSVREMATNLIDSFKELLGIHSPSTVFKEFGLNIVQGLVNGILGAISLVGKAIAGIGGALKNMDVLDVVNAISAIFGGAVLLTVYKFIRTMSSGISSFATMFTKFGGVLDETTGTLKTMQSGIKAKALLNIALAIGVLALSLWVLSKIPADKLAVGMGAITFMMYQLMGVMKAMSAGAATTKTAVASMVAMSFAMGLMAAAVLLLSAAVLAFGSMKTETLVKGFIAIGVATALLVVAARILSQASPYLILGAAAMAIMAGSLLILAAALTAFVGVLKLYEKLDWKTVFGGIGKMAVVLVGLGVAMIPLSAMAPLLLIASAALIVLAAGLTAMLGVIKLFDKVSWGTIIGGVGKIGAALIILGLAAAIAAPGLILLGAAAVLLGAGFMMVGVGLGLAGAGLAAIAAAGVAAGAVLITTIEAFLAILPLMAVQLVAALTALVTALAHEAPKIVDGLVKIGSEILRGLGELIPKIAEKTYELIQKLLDVMTEHLPEILEAGTDLVVALINGMSDHLTEVTQAATDLVVALLAGIGKHTAELVTAGGKLILDLLTAIDEAVQKYTEPIVAMGQKIGFDIIKGVVLGLIPDPIQHALTDMVNKFVNWFKNLLGINSPSTVFAGFGRNIVEGLANGVRNAVGMVTGAVSSLVSGIISRVSSIPGRARGALSGLGGLLSGAFSSAFKAATGAVGKGVSAIGSGIGKIPGILRGAVGTVKSAATKIGDAVVDGIKSGLKATVGAIGGLGSAVTRMVKDAINGALNLPFNVSLHIPIPAAPDVNFGPKTIIPKFAKGVTGFGGGAALVGEVGPELVTMGRGANVITNEKLMDFIKTVSSLVKTMTAGSGKNSPGGNIQYVVSAGFRGDPRATGTMFAANIAAGLINGLKSNQSGINSTMANVGSGAAKSFADILGIQSPSTVFKKYAGFVGQGFINGLLASVAGVQAAATALGNAAILAIAKTITDGQLKLEAVRGKADAYADAADELRHKARLTKNKKRRAELEKQAKALDKQAAKQQRLADAEAKRVEAANAAAERKEQFDNSDTQGKADMRKEDAATAAAKASAAREAAIRLSKEADLVRKYDKKRAAEIDAAAKKQLELSKKYADQANDYAKESYELSEKAKQEAGAETAAAIAAQLQSVTADQVAAAQAAFDSYSKSLADAGSAMAQDVPPMEVTFEQNNYSPEAISASDAYRGGKTLLSIAERKLADLVSS